MQSHSSEPTMKETGHHGHYPGKWNLRTWPETVHRTSKSDMRIQVAGNTPCNLITIDCGGWSNGSVGERYSRGPVEARTM